jgi:hypothetical protein
MLKSTHNAGFFSCCNIKLCDILNYFNTNMSLPTYVDSSSQFVIYKPHRLQHTDVTSHFFITDNADSIEFIKPVIITNDNKDDHRSNYKLLNINTILPFITKYFSPVQEIIDIKNMLIAKYSINTSNCIAVYYRGTDKYKETILGDFSKFYEKIESLNDGNKMQVLIQTDTFGFLEYIKSKCLNTVVVDENKVSNTNVGIHIENNSDTNYNDIKYLFATFLIMSECKYLIVSAGNCSLWMMYYRGGVDNVYQCLDNLFIS